MKLAVRLSLILIAPYLLVVYWRNSLKEIDGLHTRADFYYE